MNFEQARTIAWWHKPWWWGGHGSWWVAPWGLADQHGFLMAVGARQWLRDHDPLYRPQRESQLYFVTMSGFPRFEDSEPEVVARVIAMTPVGEWPTTLPPPFPRLP